MLAHLFIQARLPDADPYMFPLAALLAAVGLVLIYRIDAELRASRRSGSWSGSLFCVTILLVRDTTCCERYRYTIAASIGLLADPGCRASARR